MAINAGNSFRTRDKLNVGAQTFDIHRLEFLEKQGVADLAKLPFSLRILLENLLRCEDGRFRLECRVGVSTQRRAVRVSPMGTDSVSELQSRSTGHWHLPPGELGIPRASRLRNALWQPV